MRHLREVTLFLVFFGLAVSADKVQAQDEQILDEIVAIVGDYIILKSDVDGFVMGMMQQQQLPYSDELWLNSRNQLIDEKVLVIHAKRDTKLVVSDEQVERMLDQRIGQMSVRVGGDKELEKIYGRRIVDLRDDLTPDFRDQLLADQLRNNRLRSIKATPSDIDDWFS